MDDVTHILSNIEAGDSSAAEKLLPLVYEELRRLAAAKMIQEQPGQTLQATALVHEAYLRLVGSQQSQSWRNRGHFFGAAAEAMRRILVDQARKRNRLRHGGQKHRIDLDPSEIAAPERDHQLLALNEALDRIALEEPVIAEVVKLRYFAGLTIEQTAELLGISVRTANRHWNYAKAKLYQELR